MTNNDILFLKVSKFPKLIGGMNAREQSFVSFVKSGVTSKKAEITLKKIAAGGSDSGVEDRFNALRNEGIRELKLNVINKEFSLIDTLIRAALLASIQKGQLLNLKFNKRYDVALMEDFNKIYFKWLRENIEALTHEYIEVTPTQWAEENRYLPASVTVLPGQYDGSVAPFMKEIVDAFKPDNPIREVYLMKGVQICATTAIIENIIGYSIEHIKSSPMMLVTADAELAKLRMEENITPMLQNSGLSHLIKPADENNPRKTGKTDKKISWIGGGFLIPLGAQNAAKLRSVSIKDLLLDEMDGYPDAIGKDGDPVSLSVGRTKAFEATRKIFGLSTPLVLASSKINERFLRGDQRYYEVPCRKCKKMQALRWSGTATEKDGTAHKYGITWEMDGGQLVPDSVRYICKFCGHAHRNEDKSWMLGRGEWKPTKKAVAQTIRSYHLNALYSPIGMQTWEACVLDWLAAWDVENKTPRDFKKFQVFYNNILGLPFEIMGDKVRFTNVSGHRRAAYRLGQIPNEYAREHSGGNILFLTCQVDVHKLNLAVSVMGWTRGARCYLIDYWRFEDDNCTDGSSPVWGRLRELIEETTYTADDGKKYRIIVTLIDAAFENELVCDFCSVYSQSVFPILGRDRTAKNQRIQEFAEFKTQSGTIGYRILVDHYKDRLAPVLRRGWHEEAGQQKSYHFNAPIDLLDKPLKELTVESRREKVDDKGSTTYFWHRPGNASNELWDLLVYGHAAVEILAWKICVEGFKLEIVDWPKFWEYLEVNKVYYKEPESPK